MNNAKQSATDAFKTASKWAIQNTAETTDDLICNKIADKITKVLRTSPQNSSEIVKNEHDKEISKKRSIHPEEKQ